MDFCGRRGRRCRGRSYANLTRCSLQCQETWSFMTNIYNFFIMMSLLAVIYLMLEYHCSTCASNYDLKNITTSLENITTNLLKMKDGYKDLETKVSQFSQELPKIEGQLDILDSLANALAHGNCRWNSKNQFSLPSNVDVFLRNKHSASKCCPTEGQNVCPIIDSKNVTTCMECPFHHQKNTEVKD